MTERELLRANMEWQAKRFRYDNEHFSWHTFMYVFFIFGTLVMLAIKFL